MAVSFMFVLRTIKSIMAGSKIRFHISVSLGVSPKSRASRVRPGKRPLIILCVGTRTLGFRCDSCVDQGYPGPLSFISFYQKDTEVDENYLLAYFHWTHPLGHHLHFLTHSATVLISHWPDGWFHLEV